MLLKIKNPELYKRWISYYDKQDMEPYAKRTYAFLNSNAGRTPPYI